VRANKVGEVLNPHQFHSLIDRFGRSKSHPSNISLNPRRRRTSTTKRERELGMPFLGWLEHFGKCPQSCILSQISP